MRILNKDGDQFIIEYCIEIATDKSVTSKETGDLLEQLAIAALQTQGYEITNQIRLVASELDLLCRHKISRERVYVECKAYRDTPVTGSQLRQLLGTVQFEKLSAGWLFSTSPLSKDARGFVETWKERPESERRILRIYEPDQFIQFLIEASIIIDIIKIPFSNTSIGRDIKIWVLLITSFGNYWAALIEQPGTPKYVVCFNAFDGIPVSEVALSQIKNTNTSVNVFEFKSIPKTILAYEAYTTSQRTVSASDLYVDTIIEKLINRIKRLREVRLFDIQPIERFGRTGLAMTLELEKVGLYSAIGSDIRGVIDSLATSMPLPKKVEEILGEIAQASAPRNMIAGILNVYEHKKTYLAWWDLYDGNLEDIVPIKLAATMNEKQAIKSAIIVAAELLSLREVAKDMKIYEYAIWVENEDGNRWLGEIDLKLANPVVKSVRYKGKNQKL